MTGELAGNVTGGGLHARVAGAARHLALADPDLAALIARVGPCTLAPKPREPYEALVRAIAHQQLHGRAAEAILGRFIALHPDPFPLPHQLQATPDEALRACGFSGSKVAALRDIAARTLDGTVPGAAAAQAMSDDDLIAALVTIRGVGRWTVEMLLISTLGRPDVLPVDDFGVREGWRLIKRLDAQPRPRELARIGEAWAPWRSTAAWYLWRAADEGEGDQAPRKPCTVWMKAAGASACSQWPALRRVTKRTAGNRARKAGRCSGSTKSERSPRATRTGPG